MKNRLLLYVHFNRENALAPHVLWQLQHIRPIFSKILFISNSQFSDADLVTLRQENLIDDFLQRENKGYDFKAWSDGLTQLGFSGLKAYDSVSLMNDTCFGPVFDFAEPFEKMEADDTVDFWGITNNRSHRVTLPGDKKVTVLPDHIQSYFVSYKQKVLSSPEFESYWSNIEELDDVVKVIATYETQMSSHFESKGFKSGVLFDTRKEPWPGMLVHDFSVFNLSSLLNRRIPFLKVKAFHYGAEAVYTPIVMDELKRISDYPTDLIVNHMTWLDYPDRPYMLDSKRLNRLDVKPDLPKVGIHLHVFYPDLLQEFLDNFDKYVKNYDLYLTTDTDEKLLDVKRLTSNRENVKQILKLSNSGRDVLPWMTVHDAISKYEIAGHFHTKKSADNLWIVGESWRQEIVENLIVPAKQIFSEFLDQPNLGLAITDVPTFFQDFRGPIYSDEERIWDKMKSLWIRQGFGNPEPKKKEISDVKPIGRKAKILMKKDSYVMSYGTMLWYRPEALDSLLSLDIKDEIPEEPLPYTSILHAFERLMVYSAWGNGFDFTISQTKPINGFQANIMLNRTLRDLNMAKADIRLRELLTMTYKKIKFMIKYNLLRLVGKR